jgi:PAS domain-containing protein
MGSVAQDAGVSETGPPASHISRQGPIDQVRRLKRSVMVGVYGAIFGFIPFYAFVLHYTPEQLVIGTVIGLGIAVSAIELAFGQMFRFRKRSSYPGTLLVEVGAATSTSEATELVLEVVTDVLDLAGAAIALPDADGGLSFVATSGLNDEQVAELREVYHDEIAQVIQTQQAARLSPRDGGRGRGTIVAVPIIAWGRSFGALVLGSPGRSKDLNDSELLLGIGVAVGVSLENLRQREDLGDAASLLSATLDSTADGILVVDLQSKIVSFNRRFVEMWRIPDSVLETRDDTTALQFAMSQLEQPEEFVRKVSDIYHLPGSESFDTLDMKDGRVFERYSQPQTIDGGIVGRVWCFRDVTERKLSEETIRHLAYHDALTDCRTARCLRTA